MYIHVQGSSNYTDIFEAHVRHFYDSFKLFYFETISLAADLKDSLSSLLYFSPIRTILRIALPFYHGYQDRAQNQISR